MGKFEALINKLNIDEDLTKPVKKPRKFNKVKNNIPLVEDYNMMADVLFLPTTKQGYKYLFVITDLANDDFDFEPIKDKEPSTILKAMNIIFKRPYIKKPHASIATDSGNEFKGVFQKYLYDESILHKVALPGRHTQMSSIDNLNKMLGRLFNGFMNSVEIKTGKVYREWTDVIDIVREDLNEMRKKQLPQNIRTHIYPVINTIKKPKFKKGDMVHRLLDNPRNMLNEKVHNLSGFREGDLRWDPIPVKVTKILYYDGEEPIRYLLSGIKNASFAEYQLKLTKLDIDEEVDEIKAIIDKSYNRKEKMWYYRIQMFGESKKQSGWYGHSSLMETIDYATLQEFLDIYEENKK